MKNLLLFLTIAFCINSLNAQLPGNWTQEPDFPGIERYASQGFVLNGKGYLITGYNTSVLTLAEVWEFDPVANSWTQKADFPGGKRWYTAGFTIGGKGYMGSGHITNDWWEYDPVTDSWTQKNNFPFSPRAHTVSFSFGNKGYVGLGSPYGSSTALSDFWEYDQPSDTWTQLPDFPGGPRRNAIVITSASKAYIGTGDYPIYTYHNDLWEFDPTNNSWQQKADFPGLARTVATSFSMDGFGYAGMGTTMVNNSFFHLKDVWRYNTLLDYWHQVADFPEPRKAHPVTFTFGSVAYVATGYTQGKHVWKFTDEKLNVNIEEAELSGVNIYPNPASGVLNLTGIKPGTEIKIINYSGQIVFTFVAEKEFLQLDLEKFNSGFYIVKIKTNNKVVIKKFVLSN